MYIRNKSKSILILMGGCIRLAPAGEPASVRAISPNTVNHPDLQRADVEVLSETEYVAQLTAQLTGMVKEAVPVSEKPTDVQVKASAAHSVDPTPELTVEEVEEVEEAEEVEADNLFTIEEFKALDFPSKKEYLRELGLDQTIKLSSNKSVDAGYSQYLSEIEASKV